MASTWLTKSSFYFGDVDMWDSYGIQIADDGMPKDVLIPNLRARKMTIPNRSGAYDFGAEYYDERQVMVTCVTTRMLSREQAMTMAFTLSKKAPIRFWNAENRFYFGRIYQAPELEMLRNIGTRFTLTFICDPFLYGEKHTVTVNTRTQTINYAGTAPTPVLYSLQNIGSMDIESITITQTDSAPSYITAYPSGFEIVSKTSTGNVEKQTVCSIGMLHLHPGETLDIDSMAYMVLIGDTAYLRNHSGGWIDKLNRRTTRIEYAVSPISQYMIKMTYQDRYL